MYVPSYESLLPSLRTNKEALETSNEIPIPVALLKLLLQLAVARSDFDEDGYLGANPDVREAVRRGHVESGQMHYIGYGYFEGRRGGTVKVDEQSYMHDNPDVAVASNGGLIKSAEDHFYTVGAAEGRSPSADQAVNAAEGRGCFAAGKGLTRFGTEIHILLGIYRVFKHG
jgi:hypothetical protein